MLEALGGPDERVRGGTAAEFVDGGLRGAEPGRDRGRGRGRARGCCRSGGLDDALFEHDGQITKREVRAVTLAALAPRRGELLWDIGAGAGSVAIEWMLRHPSLRRDRGRGAGRTGRRGSGATRVALGVPGLAVVEGAAPAALGGLPAPDAIFLGGGGSDAGRARRGGRRRCRPGGRLVANAVTLEMQALLLGDGGAARRER